MSKRNPRLQHNFGRLVQVVHVFSHQLCKAVTSITHKYAQEVADNSAICADVFVGR